jgi:predicted DNA-binding protein
MKEIHLNKTKDFQIGNVRVDKELFEKIRKLADENEVTMQTIVREILVNFIDEVIIKN